GQRHPHPPFQSRYKDMFISCEERMQLKLSFRKTTKGPGKPGPSNDHRVWVFRLSRQALVGLAARIEGVGAEAADLVLFVILEIAFEPFDMTITFEGEDMRRQAVEEHAIVADDDG